MSSLGISLNKGIQKDLPFLPFAFFWACAPAAVGNTQIYLVFRSFIRTFLLWRRYFRSKEQRKMNFPLALCSLIRTFAPRMKKWLVIFSMIWTVLGVQAEEKETPNAQQAKRMFMETYKMIYGDKGSQLTYKVNIIGIYKTEGTIWTKGKKSKFIDEKYIAWNDDVTYYRLERKKSRIVIYDAHSDERDKYATKFKFVPDNYTYSIKDSNEGYYITLKAKKGVKGIKEARCLLDKKTRYPISVRIKLGIFHTTIKISNVKVGGISDDLFHFPKEKYSNQHYEYVDKR